MERFWLERTKKEALSYKNRPIKSLKLHGSNQEHYCSSQLRCSNTASRQPLGWTGGHPNVTGNKSRYWVALVKLSSNHIWADCLQYIPFLRALVFREREATTGNMSAFAGYENKLLQKVTITQRAQSVISILYHKMLQNKHGSINTWLSSETQRWKAFEDTCKSFIAIAAQPSENHTPSCEWIRIMHLLTDWSACRRSLLDTGNYRPVRHWCYSSLLTLL